MPAARFHGRCPVSRIGASDACGVDLGAGRAELDPGAVAQAAASVEATARLHGSHAANPWHQALER
jgi:hypothetical protein